MRFRAIVFDFDGTLVDSAAAKRQAFFDIFPDSSAHRAVISQVLREDPDGSRHRVIPRMVGDMHGRGLPHAEDGTAAHYIEAYAQAALTAVRACPEIPGAGRLLRSLWTAGIGIYVCSNTPHDALTALIRDRGWSAQVTACFGHPHDKSESIAAILAGDGLQPFELAVVGDGISDQEAAAANNCPFFHIAAADDLLRHAVAWEVCVA